MKKKKLANLVMVLVIALIVVSGVTTAYFFREEEPSDYGSKFHQIEQSDESSESHWVEISSDSFVMNEEPEKICTITIRCDTILDNIEDLEKAKLPYVPKNGEILPVMTVEFEPGDTVFDVLQRVCEAADLQIEYSWTPLYDSYYVEGINHLYEFDCGFESGWMYKVNGWFPNYGCSSYELQGGEEIVWCYSCAGLGADVGAERME